MATVTQSLKAAVQEQHSYGAVFNQPGKLMVELAEKLVEQIDFAKWAVFAKNGSDLTTWAIRVAREQTGREYVIKAKGAYHGWTLGVTQAWADGLHRIGHTLKSLSGMILISLNLFSGSIMIKLQRLFLLPTIIHPLAHLFYRPARFGMMWKLYAVIVELLW